MSADDQKEALLKVKDILSEYEREIGRIEDELKEVVFEYQGILKQERIAQLKRELSAE